ncbi:unnamed protein product [Gadus morhua 'NCC']
MQSGEHGTPGNIGTLPDSSLPLSILHLAVSWEGHLLVHTCLEGKASLKIINSDNVYPRHVYTSKTMGPALTRKCRLIQTLHRLTLHQTDEDVIFVVGISLLFQSLYRPSSFWRNEGTYKCIINHGVGRGKTEDTKTTLSITATPDTVTLERPIPGSAGDVSNASLTCTAVAVYPVSKMSWNVSGVLEHQWENIVTQDKNSLLFNISSTAFFNCSDKSTRLITCSLGGVSSDEKSVCQQPKGHSLLYCLLILIAPVLGLGGFCLPGKMKNKSTMTTDAGVVAVFRATLKNRCITCVSLACSGADPGLLTVCLPEAKEDLLRPQHLPLYFPPSAPRVAN